MKACHLASKLVESGKNPVGKFGRIHYKERNLKYLRKKYAPRL